MSEEELWKELRKMVKEEVAAYLGVLPGLQVEEIWIGTAALCQELDMSKQTSIGARVSGV